MARVALVTSGSQRTWLLAVMVPSSLVMVGSIASAQLASGSMRWEGNGWLSWQLQPSTTRAATGSSSSRPCSASLRWSCSSPCSSSASRPAPGRRRGSVGLLIAWSTMIGGLLTHSGMADRIVGSFVHRVGS